VTIYSRMISIQAVQEAVILRVRSSRTERFLVVIQSGRVRRRSDSRVDEARWMSTERHVMARAKTLSRDRAE